MSNTVRQIDSRRVEVVDDAVADILRRKKPYERVQMAFEANRTARAIVETCLRSRHPDWDDAHVRREVARRMLGGAD